MFKQGGNFATPLTGTNIPYRLLLKANVTRALFHVREYWRTSWRHKNIREKSHGTDAKNGVVRDTDAKNVAPRSPMTQRDPSALRYAFVYGGCHTGAINSGREVRISRCFVQVRMEIEMEKMILLGKVKVTLRLTVSQSVCLGVEPRLGLMTRFFFLYMKVTVLFIWGALSDERSGLSFVSHSLC